MRKFLYTAIATLLTLYTYAQKGRPGVYITGARIYRTIDKNIQFDNSDDQAQVLYGGLSYRAALHKNLNLLTGMEYSVSGYDRLSGNASGYVHETRHRLRYIGVPTALEYKVVARKFYASLSAGIMHKLLISGKFEPFNFRELPWYYPNPPTNLRPRTDNVKYKYLKEAGYHMYNPDLLAGIQVGYTYKSLVIGLGPEFRYALVRTMKKGYVNYHTDDEHLHSLGIKLFVTGGSKENGNFHKRN
jgi:hypothetical protein